MTARLLAGGELARRGVELDLEDVLPCVRERHLDLHRGADDGGDALVAAPLAPNAQGQRLAGVARLAGLTHGDLDIARLADDAVARRREHLDAPVELVGRAGQQCVHRGIEAERGG